MFYVAVMIAAFTSGKLVAVECPKINLCHSLIYPVTHQLNHPQIIIKHNVSLLHVIYIQSLRNQEPF